MEGTPAPNGTTGYLPIVAHRPVKEGYLQRVQSAPDIKPIELAIQHVQRFDPGSVLIHYMEELLGKHADLRREIEETLYQAMRAVTSNDWREQGTLPSSLGTHRNVRINNACLRKVKQAYTTTIDLETKRIGFLTAMQVCAGATPRHDPTNYVQRQIHSAINRIECVQAALRNNIANKPEAGSDSDAIVYDELRVCDYQQLPTWEQGGVDGRGLALGSAVVITGQSAVQKTRQHAPTEGGS